jgi:hypothetical protein
MFVTMDLFVSQRIARQEVSLNKECCRKLKGIAFGNKGLMLQCQYELEFGRVSHSPSIAIDVWTIEWYAYFQVKAMAKEGRYGAGSHRTEGVAQRLVENV